MKGTGLLTWRDYKHRNPQNQYPVVRVDMKWRTKEGQKRLKELLKLARQNANKTT